MADYRLFYRSGIGHGERINKLSDFEFIVWAAYQLSADDFGVLRLSAVTLQADHDRLSTKSTAKIERALLAGVKIGLLATFEHQRRRYVCQLDWQDWQKVRYPSKTSNPLPPLEILQKCSAETQELFSRHVKTSPQIGENVSTKSIGITGPEVDLPHANANAHANENDHANALATRPFKATGQPPMALGLRRLRVWRWMLEDLIGRLGVHAATFDLDGWLSDLDRRDSGVVPTGKPGWEWLQAEFTAEVKRRGLAAAMPTEERFSKNTNRLLAAVSGLPDTKVAR
jgi:hypothetical protein